MHLPFFIAATITHPLDADRYRTAVFCRDLFRATAENSNGQMLSILANSLFADAYTEFKENGLEIGQSMPYHIPAI